MFSYKEIFDNRADLYHKAMVKYPHARDEEFKLLLNILNPKSEQIIADIPSGGQYLKHKLDSTIKLFNIDPSNLFCEIDNSTIINASIDNTPFEDNYLDGIFSLSGLHHLENRLPFYKEAYRILKPNGVLAIGDVAQNSFVGDFLNIFINSVNPMGHDGIFINTEDIKSLNEAGFKTSYEIKKYHWNFDNIESMSEFCTLLFGANCNQETMINGIKKYLDYTQKNNGVSMNWELKYIQAVKK
ncbi:class I SAM-dependent methyltransferase [bacterium]|nr:class I SAM-dependent methyltransferase [bacterium]